MWLIKKKKKKKKQQVKSLVRFHSADKTDKYNGGRWGTDEKKKTKESTQHVKT